jgi:hypothetical protein
MSESQENRLKRLKTSFPGGLESYLPRETRSQEEENDEESENMGEWPCDRPQQFLWNGR